MTQPKITVKAIVLIARSLARSCEYAVDSLRRGKLAATERWPDIGTWLATLRQARSVFHPEADFQQALAWAIHMSDSSARVHLETRPAPGMRLDLLIWRPDVNMHLALELKYLTAAWSGEVDGEQFGLVSQERRTYGLNAEVMHLRLRSTDLGVSIGGYAEPEDGSLI